MPNHFLMRFCVDTNVLSSEIAFIFGFTGMKALSLDYLGNSYVLHCLFTCTFTSYLHISLSLTYFLTLYIYFFQGVKMPWKAAFTSLPVWAIIIAHFTENWGFYTLLTELPTFLKDVLHFDLQGVCTIHLISKI